MAPPSVLPALESRASGIKGVDPFFLINFFFYLINTLFIYFTH